MPVENKRLLMEVDHIIKQINRDTLNPLFPKFVLNDLKPTVSLTAKARGAYLQELFKMGLDSLSGQTMTLNEAKKLREKRLIYEELMLASQALETAIQRNYLDVIQKNG